MNVTEVLRKRQRFILQREVKWSDGLTCRLVIFVTSLIQSLSTNGVLNLTMNTDLIVACCCFSDGTLNPAGVRFGSAEIYNIGKNSCFYSKGKAKDNDRISGRATRLIFVYIEVLLT